MNEIFGFRLFFESLLGFEFGFFDFAFGERKSRSDFRAFCGKRFAFLSVFIEHLAMFFFVERSGRFSLFFGFVAFFDRGEFFADFVEFRANVRRRVFKGVDFRFVIGDHTFVRRDLLS